MDLGVALVAAVGALALFTFLSITVFSESRAKERSEFHRNETLRKVAEQTGQGAEKVLEVIEGLKLGGLITTMVGIGLGIFLYTMAQEAVAIAAIQLLIGVGLLGYVLLLAPKPE